MRHIRARPLISIALAATLTLVGCSGQPERPGVDTEPATGGKTSDGFLGPDYVPGQFAPYLNEAEEAMGEAHWLAAIAALQKVPRTLPPGTDSYRRSYLQARVTLQEGDANTALTVINTLLDQPIDRDLRQRNLTFQRHLLQLSGRFLESARIQAQRIAPDLPQVQLDQLRQSVWHDLQRVPEAELAKARSVAEAGDWQGWLTIAELDASAGADTARLRQGLLQWQRDYPSHPCAEQLPGGLNALLQEQVNIERVVMMLPLSGRLAPAGKAVRDGYLAAWYQAKAKGWQAPELQLIDLARAGPAKQAYTAAVAQGSNLVIGPLSKDRVSELANDPMRTVPILALNRLDEPSFQGSAPLVQLSLAPEDEARELARMAYSRGHRQVLLLHPSARWGSKMATAFSTEWQRLGARITASAGYSGQDDFSSTVESALGLPASQARARRVRQALATNVEFTPRRREDLDAVIILARGPAEARALKPLLAYHYAGTLPVYSTSHASLPGASRAANADLNGLQVLEMPWLLSDSLLRQQLERGGETDYSRMQALGVDAFLLQARFRQLNGGAELALRGRTGLLSLDPQLRVIRTLSSGVIDGGRVQPAPLY